MSYVEQQSFLIRLQARADFPADYAGEADGYAWAEEFNRVKARVYAAVMRELSLCPGFTVHPANRGVPTDEEVSIICQLEV